MTRKGWAMVALAVVLVAAGFVVTSAIGKEAKEARLPGGVSREVTSDVASDYGVQPGAGVLVEGVSPGSPAAEAGLRENDVIVRVNKATPTGPGGISEADREFKTGRHGPVSLSARRQGKDGAGEAGQAHDRRKYGLGEGKGGRLSSALKARHGNGTAARRSPVKRWPMPGS